MLKIVILTICVLFCVEGVDISKLLSSIQKSTKTCTPACGEGECCVSFWPPVASKRALDIDTSKFLPNGLSSYPMEKVYMCQKIKQKGDKCLTRNTGEWCDCDQGLTCTARGKTGLDRFFGACTQA